MEGLHIALAPETLWHIGAFSFTNSLFTAFFVTAILSVFAFLISSRLSLIPGRLQNGVEMIISFGYDYVKETLEDEGLARRYFPLIISIFIFVLLANWMHFIPGFGSIGFFEGEEHEFISIFRAIATDLNFTLALALISFVTIEYAGFSKLGILNYGSKFVNFKSVLGFFVGIIDLFSELARVVSFSFRLFGNIFAGEVIISLIVFFLPYLAPVPVMLFEVFVGLIQAAIFALLTLFFIKIAAVEAHH